MSKLPQITEEEDSSSEELCVYLTMVFSNKMMKGLLIVLSVSEALSLCPQIVRQQALLNTTSGASEHT